MNEYYTLLTSYGISKIVEAKATKKPINLSSVAVGDGDMVPSESMSALKSEKHRFAINSIEQDKTNPNYLVIEAVLPSSVGGFYISEIGIFDEAGKLFAVGNMAKTYKPLLSEGSAKDITFKIIIEVANASSVSLKVDESVVLATREWVKNIHYTKTECNEKFLPLRAKATDSELLDGLDSAAFVKKTELAILAPKPNLTTYRLISDSYNRAEVDTKVNAKLDANAKAVDSDKIRGVPLSMRFDGTNLYIKTDGSNA